MADILNADYNYLFQPKYNICMQASSNKCSGCKKVFEHNLRDYVIPVIDDEYEEITSKSVYLCKRCADRLARSYRSLRRESLK